MLDLQDVLQSLEQRKKAPTELWDPPYCGELPIRIDEQGNWYYQDSRIQRIELVRLFASVLARENDDYFLITPAEKVKITVEDAPFLIVGWDYIADTDPRVMQLTTNIGDRLPLSANHPVILRDNYPYVDMGQGLVAKVHRNVYYQWVDAAEAQQQNGTKQLIIQSAGQSFVIGELAA
ncbi:hypothetical protein IDSA_11555 [Pseudidiomarina salinarum]|uniref:Proteophosphoglycan n=1 Tax=Pseudidiomarina salinarum TaxID=435908 RepID=A0A094IWI5_9GAMM|nr:DUF1285 domain-containing protein [Pseudidiomarina salinarum]KFZ30189.1 hypothetical protein IDSA_11555 [Pseudidiomarina salinarum]RUO68690.1 DUF1285 domain-containing protein [Pseudidiomarina salinarum]